MFEGGVLTGPEIQKEVDAGGIVIEPFNENQVNTASYDLRLGGKVAVYASAVHVGSNELRCGMKRGSWPPALEDWLLERTTLTMGKDLSVINEPMDVRRQQHVYEFDMHPEHGWLLKPGIGYLMHTDERIYTERFIPVLDGKSSIGRLFVVVHVTAGYGDTGFDGQYTLEVVATHPVVVYPGMRIAQMRFHTVVGETRNYGMYGGNYTQEAAKGPVPSRAWRQR
jgi:dCTP deaminase